MRVLHLLGQAEDHGGILSVIRGLQESTREEGVEHVVWVRRGYNETRRPGLTYRFTDHLVSDSPRSLEMLSGAMRAWRELKELRRNERFDVWHAHSRGGFLVACLMASMGRDKVLFTNHSFARRTWMYRSASRMRRFHSVVLTPSMNRHYRLHPRRARIIPACFADRFMELELPCRREVKGGPIRLVGVGNVVRWKNWHLILRALAKLSAAERGKFLFEHWGPVPDDGDAPAYFRELEGLTDELGLRAVVRWKGPTGDVTKYLAGADWFVLPSTDEPCSVALMESLAVGVPVIASSSGGNVDLVGAGRTGLLFKPEDVGDLAEILGQVARGEVGFMRPEVLRESVKDKRASAVGKAYLELYRELAA